MEILMEEISNNEDAYPRMMVMTLKLTVMLGYALEKAEHSIDKTVRKLLVLFSLPTLVLWD